MVNAALFSLALAGFSALAAAQPHRNQHRHVARNNNIVTQTTTLYVTVTGSPPDASAVPIPAPSSASIPAPVAPTQYAAPSVVSTVISSIAPIASSIASSSASAVAPSASAASSDNSVFDLAINLITGAGLDTNPNTGLAFPDGQLGCDQFPSKFGAIPLSWVTKQGWSGIQIGGANGDAAGTCPEGGLCSYACPAGFSKSQWPASQPASGESHGGLLCQGGKLRLTRPAYPHLCQPGVGGVTVVNKLKQLVSICRTDYPGKPQLPIFVLVATY